MRDLGVRGVVSTWCVVRIGSLGAPVVREVDVDVDIELGRIVT